MTKLKWEKADLYGVDPARIIDVPESTRSERWTPPKERERMAADRAKRNRELKWRSEERDRELFSSGLERQIRASQERGEVLSALEQIFLKRRDQQG